MPMGTEPMTERSSVHGSERGIERGSGVPIATTAGLDRTGPLQPDRRRWLARLGLLGPLSAWSSLGAVAAVEDGPASAPSGGHSTRMVAAWRAAEGERIGLLDQGPQGWQVARALTVPTRAHGLLAEGEGRYLAVARRPGDWLLRWDHDGRELAWAWSEPDRAFNGHVIASRDRQWLYTTETDLDTGAGLIGVREAASLEKVDEWSTGGLDPHELVLDRDGSLIVANGGIPTLPETGRLKIGLDRMDASLVRLAGDTGELLGQWRLGDRRLSLRHLAWTEVAGQRRLGIALQAEHEKPGDRVDAPVLARFDGRQLQVCAIGPVPAQVAGQPASHALAGYGGSITATPEGWAVSCPRARTLALWRADGRWAGALSLDEVCALASADGRLWAGGRDQALLRQADGHTEARGLPPLQLDNHWVLAGR